MLVPVSPSGTGKTLSRLISSWCALSHARLPSSACFKSWPSTARGGAGLSRPVIFVDPLHEDVDLRNRHPHRPLHLEAHRPLQVVRHLGDARSVLDHHVDVDGQLSVDLADLHPSVHVLAAEQRGHALAEAPGRHPHPAVALGGGMPGEGADHGRKALDAAALPPRAEGPHRGAFEINGLLVHAGPYGTIRVRSSQRSVQPWHKDAAFAVRRRSTDTT